MGDRYINLYYQFNVAQNTLDFYIYSGDRLQPLVNLMYVKQFPLQYDFERVVKLISDQLETYVPHATVIRYINVLQVSVSISADSIAVNPLFKYHQVIPDLDISFEGDMTAEYWDYNIVLLVDRAITRCMHEFE
jgi:hypothetical protein